ncbi:caspase domain-containing protein [Streptomyces sp. NPDC059863]|uniref:caspase family protein n=1 Tax=unclassified Streptomyces TaxID=2593676 RepID=UPI0036635361
MPEDERVYRALLIGNSEYPDDPVHLQSLLGPPEDLRLMRSALTDPAYGLHLPGNVEALREQSTLRIKERLATFFDEALRHEQLLIYYSGHGLLDSRNRLHLCGRDTTVEQLRTHSVSLSFINELIDDCASRSIVVILDCCFSGIAATKGTDPAAQLAGHGRFVMTSSSRIGTAADARTKGEASPFTRHLVDGLESGADGHDGYVSMVDLYRYVHDQLRGSGQTPHIKAEAAVGAIPLARRPPRSQAERTGSAAEPSQIPVSPMELRPTFTDTEGNRALLATDTDFTGVLHVNLPQSRTVLSTHCNQLAAAAEGKPVTAQLFKRGRVHIGDLRAEVTGRHAADLDARSIGGSVSFVLPNGAGVVDWTASQVRSFTQARAEGRWPGSPLAPLPAARSAEFYERDHGYQHLANGLWGAVWSGVVSAVLFAATAIFFNLKPDGGFDELGGAMGTGAIVLGVVFIVLCLLALLSVVQRLRNAWVFLRLRSLLRSSAQASRTMVMLAWSETEHVPTGNYVSTAEVKKPWANLWEADTAISGFGDVAEKSVGDVTTAQKRKVAVPLQWMHAEDIRRRTFPEEGPPRAPATEHVEVVGTPEPGEWLVIRTETGVLWPRGRAR